MKHIKMFRAALAALVTVFGTCNIQAADIFVSPTGSGEKTGMNWSNALNGSNDGWHIDVKNAITSAVDGGAEEVNVYLAAGDYTVTNQLALSSITIPVKFSGGYVGATDGSLERGETATVFTRTENNVRHISATSLSSLRIEGITFSKGYIKGNGAKGGSIYLSDSTSIISDCVFSGNSVYGSAAFSSAGVGGGGAVAAVNGSLNLRNCRFNGNYQQGGASASVTWGGAVYANDVDLTISSCVFNKNYLDAYKSQYFMFGAAVGTYKGSISISECSFAGNYLRAPGKNGGTWAGSLAIRNATSFRMTDSIVTNCYVASNINSAWQCGLMLLDDLIESDGIMTSVVERCVFDSRGVPDNLTYQGSTSKVYARTDIVLLGGHLSMTNCLVAAMKDKTGNAEGAIAIRCGTVSKKTGAGAYSYTNTSTPYTAAKSSAELVNCTIADGTKSGVLRQVADGYVTELILKNCILSGNAVAGVVNATSIEHSYIQTNDDGSWNYEGTGNLNPNVVGDVNWTGAPYYHLLTKKSDGAITNGWFSGTFESPKCAADSPCIDAGAPGSLGLDLEPYYSGRRVNIGAYGGTPWASKTSPLPGFKLIIR